MSHIMKTILILTAWGVLAGIAVAQSLPTPGNYSLSLQESLDLAFANNKDLQYQAQEVEAARAMITGTRSQFLPRVDVSGGYTRNGTILGLGGSPDAKKDIGIFTGYINDHNLNVGLQQLVYNGGGNIAAYQQAKKNLKIQEHLLKLHKSDVVFETTRLYNGMLLAQETERITQRLIDSAQSHYEDTEKKYAAGVVSRFDVLQSKVQISKISPELIRAHNAVQLIEAQLKKILGISQADLVALKDKLEYNLFEIKETELTNLALLSSPEINLQELNVDFSKLGIPLARAEGLPQVGVAVNDTYRSNDLGDMLNSHHENWNAGVAVTVPVFDGFSSKAKVDEARIKYAQALIVKDDVTDQVRVNVKQGCLDLKKAEALINSQKDNIAEAKESLRLSQVRYDNGEGTNLDVLDAQVSLSQVEKYYLAGIFDYVMAKAFLERVLGQNIAAESDR
jgi:outer membrane protein